MSRAGPIQNEKKTLNNNIIYFIFSYDNCRNIYTSNNLKK